MDQSMHSTASGAPSSPTTPTPSGSSTTFGFGLQVAESPNPFDSAPGRNFAITQFNKGTNKRVAVDLPKRPFANFAPSSSNTSSFPSLSQAGRMTSLIGIANLEHHDE